MSGVQLVAAIERVGYSPVDGLDGAALDWMFEQPGAFPLLQWICEDIGPDNVLSRTQRQQYAELEQSGEVILDGEQLEAALQNAQNQQPSLSQDALRKEIADLEEEIRLSEERKNILLHHRNKLSLQHTAISDKVNKLGAVEKQVQSQYRAALEQSHADNAKTNEALGELTSAVCDITALYARPLKSHPGLGATPNQNAVFLSQCDLESYHKVEEKFTQELTAYTKKLFFDGIAEVTGQNEQTRYDFLEVSEPEALLVSGERESIKLEDCRELSRLQNFFPKSERERINSLLTSRGVLAACEFSERKLDALKQIPYPKESRHIKEKLHEVESVLSVLRRDEAQIVQLELPRLVTDCGTAQITKILRGDYDLKISRQDYFISNQEKVISKFVRSVISDFAQVISELVLQRARHELLTMAYEVEERGHRDLHKLLTAVNLLLQRQQRQWNDRMALMQEPGLQAGRHQRSTVDSRNTFLNNINSMLADDKGDEEHQQLFLTYDALTAHAQTLNQRFTSARASLAASNGNQDARLQNLERQVQCCEDLVYCGSSTVEGQPSLSPQRLGDAISQLDALLKNLEQVVMDIIKDVDTKKKTLKSDHLQAIERELMVYFHTDPNKLRRVIEELSSRVQAQLVT